MRANRSVPPAVVIPVLQLHRRPRRRQWLSRAFGFRERLTIGTHRVQMMFEGGALVVRDGGTANAASGNHSVLVRVADADAHCARAREHGAKLVHEPETYPYGERQYTAVDSRRTRLDFLADRRRRGPGGVGRRAPRLR